MNKIIAAIFLFALQIACRQNKVCEKFAEEKYIEIASDTAEINEANIYFDTLCKRFDMPSIKVKNNSVYSLFFYNAFGEGKSIVFEQIDTAYYLNKIIIYRLNEHDCKEMYRVQISRAEWEEFEEMVYDFEFWTAQKFKSNKDVLDGHVFFLEAKRPNALGCKKRDYHLIGRANASYDKMDDLCKHIVDYEKMLAHKYGH